MDVGGLDAWAWSRICNLKTLTLKAGGLAAEEYVKIDQGWLYRLWNCRYFAGKAFVGGSNPPPLYGGLWVTPRPIFQPRRLK